VRIIRGFHHNHNPQMNTATFCAR